MRPNCHRSVRPHALLALWLVSSTSLIGCTSPQPSTAEIAAPASERLNLSVAGSGGGERLCGSRGLPRCNAGEYCRFSEAASCGETDHPGVCSARPDVCTQIFRPVCGCNGRTYGNACLAAAAGVSVRSRGACEDREQACGGLLGLACDEGEYCDFAPEALCGRADATGLCEPKPFGCTKELAPVCGCDGNTYGNACMAAAAGVSVEFEGACPSAGEICGGILGVSCPDGQYCDFAAGDGCDVADGQGVCSDQPQFCTEEFDPICGCDGVTYSNACAAAASGASVRAPGKCPGYRH